MQVAIHLNMENFSYEIERKLLLRNAAWSISAKKLYEAFTNPLILSIALSRLTVFKKKVLEFSLK